MKITRYVLVSILTIVSMVGLVISHDIKSTLMFGFLYIGSVIQMVNEK